MEQKRDQDLEIVRNVQNGDVDAFAELVRRHHSRVLNVCAGVVGWGPAAEDAAQDVFVRAFERLHSFRGDAAFTTWIHRLATNHCLDVLRSQNRRKAVSWDGLLEEHGDRIERLLDRKEAEPALAEDLKETVNAVLDQLKPEYRAVLTLREREMLSYDEIAKVLDVSLDSVKARLKRARRDLEDRLRQILGTDIVPKVEQKR